MDLIRCGLASDGAPRERRFVPDSGGFGLVFGFAFFIKVTAVDVVYDRDGKVLHLHIL
jgi:hypothetical protein